MTLSIITVNWNNRDGLAKTLESVSAQTIRPFEFIIIDGGSTDGSVDVIRKHEAIITKWVSEPDKGIYNGMNKGIEFATGEWCLFLNSGDVLCHGKVLEEVVDTGVDADIFCGNIMLMEDLPRQVKAPEKVTLDTLYKRSICHQAAFIRTSILKTHHYDETYRICADRKLFTQALILDNCSYQAIDVNIANYDVDGFSARNRPLYALEKARVMEELFPERIIMDYGTKEFGALYGTTPYEKLFQEIGKRRYRMPIYRLVRGLLSFISLFVPSARFIKHFPKKI